MRDTGEGKGQAHSSQAHPSKLTTEPIPVGEYYSIVRRQIEHEDNLIAQRLNWFLTSQSFLLTAYAISVGNASLKTRWAVVGEALLTLIPLIAVAGSVLIWVTIVAGVLATRNLHLLIRGQEEKVRLYNFPPIHGHVLTQFMGQSGPLLLPLLFLAIWLYLLIFVRSPSMMAG